ncbi:MAG: DUF4190 domain-containing protein [Janthinobacterium lividum]
MTGEYPGASPASSGYRDQVSPYGDPNGPPARNAAGTAALVLSIVGLVLGIAIIGLVPAVVGLVLGIVGLRRVRRGLATNRGVALTGVVLSVIAILGTLIWAAFLAVVLSAAWNNGAKDFLDCASSATDQSSTQQCTRQFEDRLDQLSRD